jgi:hypothetical protein
MRSLSLALALALLASGCKKDRTDPLSAANPYRDAYRQKVLPDGLILEEVDLNGDGKPEIFNYFRQREGAARLLVRKDVDMNRDGRVDARTWYNDAGLIEMEEFDGDFDGQFDIWDHYQDVDGSGVAVRVANHVDTTYDGKPNIFTYFRDGRVVRKERDTNGDGIIDHWEKFDSEGRVIKSGRDSNYDGSVDERN